MQHRFAPIAQPIAARLASFGQLFLENRIPVVLTMHHDKPSVTTELVNFWGDDVRIEKGSHEWELMEEIANLQEQAIILDDKTAYATEPVMTHTS